MSVPIALKARSPSRGKRKSKRFCRPCGSSNTPKIPSALDRVRILELANKAHSLYVRQTPQKKTKLLRMVLSNCAVDAVSVYPTYREPFDMIFERAKSSWSPGAVESAWEEENQFQPGLCRPGRRHQRSARRYLAGELYGL